MNTASWQLSQKCLENFQRDNRSSKVNSLNSYSLNHRPLTTSLQVNNILFCTIEMVLIFVYNFIEVFMIVVRAINMIICCFVLPSLVVSMLRPLLM